MTAERTSKTARERFVEAMRELKPTHHYCEDSWYSCPQAPDGCANDSEGAGCNCGAERRTEMVRQAVEAFADAVCGTVCGEGGGLEGDGHRMLWQRDHGGCRAALLKEVFGG